MQLVEFVHGIKYDDFPPDVIQKTKSCILDYIGVCLAGSKEKTGEAIVKYLKEIGGNEDATIINHRFKSSCPNAALANGSMVHGLELDDGHIQAHAHPGVSSISAALAVGEKIGSNGREFMGAIVAAYETIIRIGDAITPSSMARGFQAGVMGCFGAAVASAKLLGLNLRGTADAFGNCCLGPICSNIVNSGAMVKDLFGGWPAFTGVAAALMANSGLTGAHNLLEHKKGFMRNVAGEDFRIERIIQDLGISWEILGVYFKWHAACSLIHTTIDATLALAAENEINLDDIKRIRIRTHKFAADLNERTPTSLTAAKFSIPFCVALSLMRGHVSLTDFTPETIADPGLQNIASKVDVEMDPELNRIYEPNEDRRPSSVEITMMSGKVIENYRDIAKGWPESPLTKEEILGKFRSLASTALPSGDRIERIVDALMNLENIKNIKEITSLLK